jgi:molybdopterin-biosynthesis enzyme MoeA-like protein
MKKVKVEKAAGMILAHDITRIVPGEFKGVGFKKGHRIQEKDIPQLLKMGKQHLYVMNLPESHLHEDEAALRIAEAVTGPRLYWKDPVEGKTVIHCQTDGLLKINTAGLLRINRMSPVILSTLKTNMPCQKNQIVAATRIIPLAIDAKKIEKLERTAKDYFPVIQILPYRIKRIGAAVTGTEIYKGLIEDGFDKFVKPKITAYGLTVVKKILAPDDAAIIAETVKKLAEAGSEAIIITGGLSVDPDDVTLNGVRRSGAKIVAYGSPVLPGAMFLLAAYDGIPILGLPACVYYHPTTIFDIVFPRVIAGETITKEDLARMGHGGLCQNCLTCHYPVCSFGR